MKKGLVALLTAISLMASQMSFAVVTTQAEGTAKQMERLDRGTVAVVTGNGVYISWRLFGDESLSNQAFDIYRDGTKIHTTGVHDATCYTDTSGTASNKYAVVPAGTSVNGEKTVTPWTTNVTNTANVANSIAHKDIAFTAPSDGVTPGGDTYTYSVNDVSVGDLDGDGEYELVVKWDPSLAKDNSQTGYTGEVYMDAYELDGTRMWRMDLGPNIRAGAHYTQFLVYDFDGDGRSEVVLKTAPGSKDGNGRYVSLVGKDIGEVNDSADYRSGAGTVLDGPEYLTVFYGETGEAMQTVLYDPPRSIRTDWGDGYGNRCERYLAGVAYLDGKTPSIIEVRGYYTYAYVAAYTWDGTNLTEQWLSSNYPDSNTVTYANGTTKTTEGKTLYGQGAHSLSVADVDNDTYDEIIFGSAVLDHDGTVLLYDGRGHGDAEHVSDFDNDGTQEIFMVHEAGKDSKDTIDFAVDVKRYNGDVVLQPAVGDIGRGVMANVDDAYAQQSGDLSLFWSVASDNAFNQKGESVGAKPGAANFLIYWDGDLSREILDDNKLSKYTVAGGTGRFYYDRSTSWLDGASSNNGSKATPGLVADILGDWREEMIFRSGTSGARIFFSTLPTEYRLHTLMHDSQYRCAVAWQNVAYNQPPHQSYYIGSAALAKDGNTTLNYLAPASGFDTIEYPDTTNVTPRPTVEPTPTPNTEIKSITASRVRNEIGSGASNTENDRVWISYYNNTWGAAYFGFEGIEDFDPSMVESATLKFTAISYGRTDRNRQFYFDLFGTGNEWETGTVTVSADPYPDDATKISSTECYTNYGNGDVLKPEVAASFDVTSYVKSLAKGTDEMSFIAAIPAGSGGVGACEMFMYNTPVLEIEVLKPEETVAPTAEPTTEPTTAPSDNPSQTPIVATEKVSVVTDADTYLVDSETAHGADTELKINQAEDYYNNSTPGLKNAKGLGLIRFDFGEYKDKELVSAKLVLHNKYSNTESKTSELHVDLCSDNSWNEATVTTADITVRGEGTPLSSLGISQTMPFASEYTEMEIDVTDVIKNDADGVITFTLWTQTAREQVIASKEYTGDDAEAPTLVLEYESEIIPTVAPTVAPTPSAPSPMPDMAVFTTYDATEITSDSAMLNGYCEIIRGNGVLNVDFAGIFYYWEKGNSEEIKSTPYSGFLYSSSNVSYPISGLKPSTTYVYRLNDGNEVEFTTLATSDSTPNPTPTAAPDVDVTPSPTPTATPTPDVDTTPHPIVVDSVKYVADSNVAEIVSVEERVGTVIFASFDENGKLVSISVKADHEIPFAVSTVAPDEKFVPTDDVRVYVWESLKTMKPLFTAAK